jgi:endonuclease/exonuclease/phosphatase (EEP) superfamily protein YafD
MAVGALLVTTASWFASSFWLLELLSHFRFQISLAAVIVLTVSMVRRRFGPALMAVFVVAANLVPLLPYAMPGAVDAQAAQSSLRVLAANLNLRNSRYRAARTLIETEGPDIVCLLEVTDAWMRGLAELQERYPYSVIRPDEGAYGIALFSRYPIRELEGSPYTEGGVQTAVRVGIEVKKKQVVLTLAHLKAPTSARNSALRNRQIKAIAEMIRKDPGREHILIGDLNVTPWSPHYRPLEEAAGLRNAARGHGYSPTWPAGFGLMRIPIDHILLSDGIEVVQFRTGAAFRSDHLPVVADLAVVGVQ